ncbi:MAG: hypothetical protein JOZ41_13365 [Chloroflexi bacterium]|nr:hypothetical protein [Chloroflexota bacterium]
MFKLLIFAAGLAIGAGAATAWMLSEPEPGTATAPPLSPESLQARLQLLQVRFREALAEGERAGRQTEERLRRELEAYRR